MQECDCRFAGLQVIRVRKMGAIGRRLLEKVTKWADWLIVVMMSIEVVRPIPAVFVDHCSSLLMSVVLGGMGDIKSFFRSRSCCLLPSSKHSRSYVMLHAAKSKSQSEEPIRLPDAVQVLLTLNRTF